MISLEKYIHNTKEMIKTKVSIPYSLEEFNELSLEIQECILLCFLDEGKLKAIVKKVKNNTTIDFVLTKENSCLEVGIFKIPNTSKKNFPNLWSVPFCPKDKKVLCDEMWKENLSSQNGTILYYILTNQILLSKIEILPHNNSLNPLYLNWDKLKKTFPIQRLDQYLVLK